MTELRARYAASVTSPDPVVREVARRQVARLTGLPKPTSRGTVQRRGHWAHVPLDELFAAAGNPIYARNDRAESGHEPLHRSKSGRCVLLDVRAGRWWCRGCQQHGDAAVFVMAWRGWSYRQAARWLALRYGPPATAREARRVVRA